MPNERVLSHAMLDRINGSDASGVFEISRIDSQEGDDSFDDLLLAHLIGVYRQPIKPLAMWVLVQPDKRCAQFINVALRVYRLSVSRLVLQQVGVEEVSVIVDALKAPWCQVSHLGIKQMSDPSVGVLADALSSQWCKVTRLSLQQIDTPAVRHVCQALHSEWNRLQHLILRDLSLEAVNVIADAIVNAHCNVSSYTLQGLSDEGCQLLYESLKSMSTVDQVSYVGPSMEWSDKFLSISKAVHVLPSGVDYFMQSVSSSPNLNSPNLTPPESPAFISGGDQNYLVVQPLVASSPMCSSASILMASQSFSEPTPGNSSTVSRSPSVSSSSRPGPFGRTCG